MPEPKPRAVIERAEGGMPRPEFVAELRTLVERQVLAQSNQPGAAFTDVTIVELTVQDDRNKQMDKNKWISVTVAAAVVVIVGLAVWASGGQSASVVDTVDQPGESDAVVSELDFEEWLVEIAAFAENRHEGDFQHSVAGLYGEAVALENQAIDRSAGYAFTTQCDLLPFTSSHLAEAPGLPADPAIAEKYQDLLDIEIASWASLQAKCDAVDHDLVREGLVEFPSLDTDLLPGGLSCKNLRTRIEAETGIVADFLCMPWEPAASDVENDRDLPEDFRVYLESW